MKRMVALLLGIALLLMSVAAADDDLNEIAARVENYLEDMTDDAGTQTLEECLELLKNVGNGPSKKALEIYCKILLNIAKKNFDDANQSMYTLTLLKKNFEEEFIEHSAGITSFLTVDELGAYLQGREAEYRGDWDAAMTAYEQCAAKADVLDRMMTIEGKQYGDAIDLIDAGRYDEAHAMLEKLAERNYSYAKQMLRDWATPTPRPTATPTPKPTATPTATPKPKPTATPTTVPQEVSVTITVKYLNAYGTPIADEQSMTLSSGTYSIRPAPTNLQPGYQLKPNNTEITITVYNDGTLDTDSENIVFYYEQKTAEASTPEENEKFSVHFGTAVGFDGGEVTARVILRQPIMQGEKDTIAWLFIDASTQTPGMGTKCAENGDFKWQFLDKSGPFILGENADALTGATVTSTAVVEAINAALSAPAIAENATWVSVQAFNGGYIGVGMTDEDGVITSLFVDASSQTPGFGQECENEAFTSQFIGKKAPFVLNENIDAVTSATITSQAVVDAVNSIYGY